MSIWNFWKKNKEIVKKRGNPQEFGDDDREFAYEVIRQKSELARLQREIRRAELQYQLEERKAHLEDLRSELSSDDDDEDRPDITQTLITAFLPLIAQNLLSKQQPQAVTTSVEVTPSALHLTDEQLLEYKKQIPKQYLSIAKGLSSEQLRQVIEQKIGKIDDDTFSRTQEMLH